MNPREKAIIRKNHIFLCQNIDTSIRSYLYEKSILNQDDMDVLTMSNTTKTYKIEVLLIHILPRRGINAYQEFVNALRQDEHYTHVVDVLERTLITDDELRTADEFNGTEDFRRTVDKMYQKVQRVRSVRPGGGEPLRNWRSTPSTSSSSSGSTGLDETDGASVVVADGLATVLPPDTFEVQLEASEASDRCKFGTGSYLLHLSQSGIALINYTDYMVRTGEIEDCPRKTTWGYQVIRQYGSGPEQFVLEVGRRSDTGPGLFQFRTGSAQDGVQIAATIKRFTATIRNATQN